jgi:hypothetical protein
MQTNGNLPPATRVLVAILTGSAGADPAFSALALAEALMASPAISAMGIPERRRRAPLEIGSGFPVP